MGWRVSWYRADKNEPITIKHCNENGEKYCDFKINGECVSSNNGTDFWLDLKSNNEEFKKEIKCLVEHNDIDLYSITKKGFKMIILEYRKRIIEYMTQYLKEFEECDFTDEKKSWLGSELVLEFKSELLEWKSCYKERPEDEEYKYFNIKFCDDKSKFGISSSWKYKYAIFDMLEVYKYFDWENDTMVVYGG